MSKLYVRTVLCSTEGGDTPPQQTFDIDDILISLYSEVNEVRECPFIIVNNEGNVVVRGV